MEEALENDVLITRCASVVDASEAVCAARRSSGIGRDEAGIVLNRVAEELVVFPLAA